MNEALRIDLNDASRAMDDALEYLYSCPPANIDNAERQLDKCRESFVAAYRAYTTALRGE